MLKKDKKEKNEHFIVAIGASAGGLEAIHEFFDNMPQNASLSFVVIQHLSPDYKSLLVELVSKHTHMKVFEAGHDMTIHKECVYIIPNNKIMTIGNGKLKLAEKIADKSPNTAIDSFLFSLAADQKDKAIAIILSGTGTDGTKGISAIKESGGLVIVQDPATAKFDGMPNSAISSGFTDLILPPEMMPEEIYNYIKETPVHTLNKGKIEDTLLEEIFTMIFQSSGHDFQLYKTPTIIRRLGKRMQTGGFKNLKSYVNYLQDSPQEVRALGQDFLINVTKFFRDPLAFKSLEELAIPDIINGKSNGETLKVWVCACSTGEEAYSIAILIDKYLRKTGKRLDVKIFATDIDERNLTFCSKNLYPSSIEKDVPEDILKTYFVKDGKGFSVIPMLRKQVVFAKHNIIKDPPFIKNDLISCRNMLIYMDHTLQKRVLATFHFSLENTGFLFLGSSESGSYIKDGLLEVDSKWKIFKKKSGYKFNHQEIFRTSDRTHKFIDSKRSSDIGNSTLTNTQIKEDFNKLILEEMGYTALYIDHNYDIKDSIGDFNKYLSLPDKKLSLNILKMLPQEISVSLNTAVRKALKTGKSIFLKSLRVNSGDKGSMVNIAVKPAKPAEGKPFHLIIFSESSTENTKAKDNEASATVWGEQDNEYVTELEAELNETRINLQLAVESMETTNEELQSSNEELLSSNEELQSSNEELQSLNEELHTLNTEHQLKIRELIELNDDLNNYFRSTDIGQIFLDQSLNIRKFNPAAVKIVNLIDTDLGRPISHISNNITDESLVDEIKKVLITGRMLEREVELNNSTHCLMRIMPYIRLDKVTDGVILSFVDITAITELNDIIKATFNSSLSAIVAITAVRNGDHKIIDFKCISANHASEKIIQRDNDDIINKSLKELAPDLVESGLFEKYVKVVEKNHTLHNEIQITRKQQEICLEIVAVKMQDGLVMTLTDITEKKQADVKLKKNYNELIQVRENLKKLNSNLEDKVIERTRKLSESEERFRLVSRATNDTIWDWDLTNNNFWWSEAFENMFGYKIDQIDNKRKFWISKIHPEDREKVIESQNTLINDHQKQWAAEYRFLRSDGQYAYILDRGYILQSDDGMPYRMLGSMFDMTRLVEADEEIRANENRFLSLANVIPQMVWTTDGEGNGSYYNKVWTDYSGLALEEIKEAGYKIVHPDDLDPAVEIWKEALKEGREFSLEQRLKNKEGEYRWHLSRALPQRNSDDQIIMWVGTNTDIHDQKVISEALKISEDHFRTVADNTPFLIWKVNEKGLCNYVNKQWVTFTGLSFKDSMDLGWSSVIHPEEQNIEYEKFIEALNKHIPYQSKFRIKRTDGQYRWMLAMSNPMKTGKLSGYIGSLTDITSQEMAQQATKLLMKKKDEFMSIASHELKTPITSMKASLQIVKRLTEKEKEIPQVSLFIEKANRQADKLSELVNDLLDVTRLQAGKLQFNKTEFKMGEAIEESSFQITSSHTRHIIEVGGSTDVVVFADMHRIEQVIINFLSNAAKYSPGSDLIKIHVSSDDSVVKVEVRDFGIGISQDKIHYVFDRFFRVQESSAKFSGLGLGLYISAQIIERHGGKVGVNSEPGKGSTFWFTIPISNAQNEV
ncbi:chemotaxis protein CheB [Daejeonella oryzae]|uniref:chemotaxis protein CheB n=1 Tax=Daejeonella oryzae TaxID=1122943 RepID=UPI0003F96986|nr:chemotaxis protein CheB [Daejeonella oryzae]